VSDYPDEGDLTSSPCWYPLSIAGGLARMVCLTETAYAAASFLDERILAQNPRSLVIPSDPLLTAASRLAPRAHYIFHIGHVGSTLISRLVGEHAAFFSVREPALLRTYTGQAMPQGAGPPPLRAVLALLARAWRGDQRTVIKATSIVNESAARILAESEAPRALLVYAAPGQYLRGILGGPNSRVEARMMAAARLERLSRRFPRINSAARPASEGEWIAMSWLCEMSALEEISRHHAKTVWIDFDAFLHDPAPGLAAILRGLGASCDTSRIESLVAGPIMRQYSKAPEHAYDAALRREVLQSADWEHSGEIRRGMSWLESVARQDPSIPRVLDAGSADHGRSE
jgi:hypothetical protein